MARPALRICPQNLFWTQPLVCGARASAICISGHWLRTSNAMTLAECLGYDLANVTARFEQFLTENPTVRGTDGLVILDLEGPIHAADWHEAATEPEQDTIIEAWKMRVGVARAALPAAELVVYGTLIPDERGLPDDAVYLARLATMQRAHTELAAYVGLNAWCPVLYVRFGPTDPGGKWGAIAAYTSQGVTGSQAIGPNLPVKPLLHYRVLNGASAHDQEQLLDLATARPFDETLGLQLDTLGALGVTEAVLWVHNQDAELIPSPNPRGHQVRCYVCAALCRPRAFYSF